MYSETMYAHMLHTHWNFQKITKKLKIFSVVGTLCAVWEHILCLTVHCLAIQIWFFNVTKYQNHTLCESRGSQSSEGFRYDFFPEFHMCVYLMSADTVCCLTRCIWSQWSPYVDVHSRSLRHTVEVVLLSSYYGFQRMCIPDSEFPWSPKR